MSTHLHSKITSINELSFEPLRAKVIKAAKAVCVNGTTVILGENGLIYCSGIKNRISYSYTPRALDNALEACIKLGLLADEAVAQHRQNEKEYSDRRDRLYIANEIAKNVEKLGFQLSKSQQAKVDQIIEKDSIKGKK